MDFIDEFIQEYKNSPCLWKADSINYKNRTKRQEAYMKLIDVAAKHGEHYNVERTKQKINNLRCAFRHQLKKYNELKKKGEKEEPYCPKRKYFESLMFLRDEETRDKRLKQDNACESINVKAEGRLLSSETESIPNELCDSDKNGMASSLQVPNNLFTDICKEIHKDSGSTEAEDEDEQSTLLLEKDSSSRLNISVISDKVLPLSQDIEEIAITPIRKDQVYIVDASSVAAPHTGSITHKQITNKSRKRSSSFSSQHSNETDHTTPIKTNKSDITLDLESLLTFACKNFQKNCNDHYTSFGDIVAHKLRTMDSKQAIYAEKIISDVLYQGQMKFLTLSTIERLSQINKCNSNDI